MPASAYYIPVWRRAPLLRLVLPLMAGIVAGTYLPLHGIATMLFIATILFAAVAGWAWPTKTVFGLAANLLFGAAGIWLVHMHHLPQRPHFIGHHYTDSTAVLATLAEPPQPRQKSWKAEATVALLQGGQWQPVQGRIILYFAKDSLPPPQYADRIIITRPLQRIRSAGNPGGFDYATYAARQGLYYQAFLRSGQYQVVSRGSYASAQGRLYRAHAWVLAQLQRYLPAGKELGLAEALLIGYRGDLDKDLVEQYAQTGVVHIIAISGMHLGLLYGLLLVLTRPLARWRYGPWLRAGLIIAVLWLFSLLTGAAPSITRAAIMFTLLVAGTAAMRKASSLNALAAAALLLLAMDPYALFNVGFQLSFAAVLSIGIFYVPLQQLWQPRLRLWRWLWQLVAVTIAAQILTTPLAVYHFHQFPTWFLLANLLAVPLSAVGLYAIIAILALSWWPAAAWLAGKLAWLTLWLMNAWIAAINQLPVGHVQGLLWGIAAVACLYVAIWGLAHAWLARSGRALVAACWALVAFGTVQGLQYVRSLRQQKLVWYHVPGHAALDMVHGRQATFVGDTALYRPNFLQNFHLLPSRIHYQVQASPLQQLPDSANLLLTTMGRTILLLRQPIDYRQSTTVQPDVLWVSNNVSGRPERLLQHIRPGHIVLDGTCSRYKQQQWQAAADSLHLPLHSVAVHGAYVWNGPGR